MEYLYQNHAIGRASSCELVIDRPAVSGHHATIRWSDGVWTLRDLGSRNGTFLNSRRIGATASEPASLLTMGDQICFAESDEVWELIDASEPRALLIPLDTDRPPLELDVRDVLALPSADEPFVSIFQRQGCWLIERDGDCTELRDRQEIVLGDLRYRLLVTMVLEATSDVERVPVERQVKDMILEFRVSRDEESAAIRAQVGSELHELPPRTYLYLLAFLARRRVGEAASLGPDAGWLPVDEVCRELGLASPEALALQVHRCRKAIKTCGVDDPVAIVDRGRRGRIRIGVDAPQLSVSSLC